MKTVVLFVCLSIFVGTMDQVIADRPPLKTYSYRCNKCGLIQTFDRPTIPRCPTDKTVMYEAR